MTDRDDRLAAQLRANLQRRKAQARARIGGTSASAPVEKVDREPDDVPTTFTNSNEGHGEEGDR